MKINVNYFERHESNLINKKVKLGNKKITIVKKKNYLEDKINSYWYKIIVL